jgi:hypothetical protein
MMNQTGDIIPCQRREKGRGNIHQEVVELEWRRGQKPMRRV